MVPGCAQCLSIFVRNEYKYAHVFSKSADYSLDHWVLSAVGLGHVESQNVIRETMRNTKSHVHWHAFSDIVSDSSGWVVRQNVTDPHLPVQRSLTAEGSQSMLRNPVGSCQ